MTSDASDGGVADAGDVDDFAGVAAVAAAFDLDPRNVRPDTPLTAVGWQGSATDWLLVADHLGVQMIQDPRELEKVKTIGDVLAIVRASV